VSTATYAGERTVAIRDWTGRGFAPEVIGYDVPVAGAEKLRVAGPYGKALPVQLATGAAKDRAILLFPADLPRDATVAYKVSNAGEVGPAEAGVKADGDALVLWNALLAVRVPKPQERNGVACKDLPAPILAFQSAGGAWRGVGKVVGEAKAEAFRVIQAAAGPVRAEVRYEIDYAGGGAGFNAVWSLAKRDGGAKPGAMVFDAVHRALLVRFPGSAQRIADALRKGFAIETAELVLSHRATELWAEGYSDPPGMSFLGDSWAKKAPRWHAVAWALRQPWVADRQRGPTFNASINGLVYWKHFGDLPGPSAPARVWITSTHKRPVFGLLCSVLARESLIGYADVAITRLLG
jgi:hypothetical protein